VLLEADASCFEHLFAAGLASFVGDPRHASIVLQRKRIFIVDSEHLILYKQNVPSLLPTGDRRPLTLEATPAAHHRDPHPMLTARRLTR
jgi:hypothetical protein